LSVYVSDKAPLLIAPAVSVSDDASYQAITLPHH
jgi:hypothetical protein